jgi:hypothetical protein
MVERGLRDIGAVGLLMAAEVAHLVLLVRLLSVSFRKTVSL